MECCALPKLKLFRYKINSEFLIDLKEHINRLWQTTTQGEAISQLFGRIEAHADYVRHCKLVMDSIITSQPIITIIQLCEEVLCAASKIEFSRNFLSLSQLATFY